MKSLPQKLAQLCLTFWLGGMWTTAYLSIPLLFQTLPERALAGVIAGKLLHQIGWLGLICASYLLLWQGWQFGKTTWRQSTFRLTLAMLALLLIGHVGIQPWMLAMKAQVAPLDIMQSALASQFKLWHGIASILYLINSLLGVWLLLRLDFSAQR